MNRIELGINFSHIRAKSLTVLNPLQRIDEHIMDDADLAGPLLFFVCFGTCLLFVSLTHFDISLDMPNDGVTTVWQTAIWIHLRRRPAGFCIHLYPSQSHVRTWHRCISCCLRFGVLSTAHGGRGSIKRNGHT